MNTAETNFEIECDNDLAFTTPIDINLYDNGGNVELKTFYEAGMFAAKELKAWKDIIGSFTSEKPFIQNIINAQLQAPRSIFKVATDVLKDEMSPTEGISIIRKDINDYLAFKSIHSQGTLGQMATIMYRYEPMLMGLIAGATGAATLNDATGFATAADAEGFTFGYAFTLQFQTDIRPEMLDSKTAEMLRKINTIVKKIESTNKQLKPLEKDHLALQQGLEASKAQLQSYRTDVAQYISQLVSEIKQTSDGAINAMWEQLNLIQNDHERQLASLRQSVSSRIRYGTALDYWNEQLKENQTKANQMTGWYVISGLFSILAVLAIVAGISFKLTNISTLLTIATLGLPISVACGLLYMLIQTKTRYERNAIQAQEKVSMLETLAALETEEKVKDEDRANILEAVFETSFSVTPSTEE